MGDPRTRRRTRLVRRWTKDTMSQTWRMRAAQRRRAGRAEALTRTLGPTPAPVWCVVANMVAERSYGLGGVERRRRTKHFAPGAKVYCLKPLWDWYPYRKQQGSLMVIGRAPYASLHRDRHPRRLPDELAGAIGLQSPRYPRDGARQLRGKRGSRLHTRGRRGEGMGVGWDARIQATGGTYRPDDARTAPVSAR
jgi:hypothetical protein